MNAIGFNAGQIGDIVMGSVAARAHKKLYPNSVLIAGVSKKYEQICNLIDFDSCFDGIHIWEGYDDWPTTNDKLNLSLLGFDKVYNAMPKHTNEFWWLDRHQTQELCLMHGLTPPDDLQVKLRRLDNTFKTNFVCLSLRGATRGDDKNISIEKCKEICDVIRFLGYTPVQIGLKTEPTYCQDRFFGTLEDSTRFVLGSKLLITVDTAMSWIASAYSHPTLGLYCHSYYLFAESSKNWQPINPNAIYLDSYKVSDIKIEDIQKTIKQML